ncbi:hypothetical protein HQ560_04710 [bacterium]|nr:hypothetical protein [bacterium]
MDEIRPSESVGHRIVRAMFVIIFFQFFWKFGGLIITVLVGSVFKAGPESDAYLLVSESVVFLLQTLCLKVFIPVVVPIFKESLADGGEEEAWRFASTVLTIAGVVLVIVTVAGMIYAPQITARIAEGFNARQAELTTRLMRLMFPGVLAVCLATVTYALLNSYNVFGYAAAGDAVQKMIWAGIFLVAAFSSLALPLKLDALAVAFVIGACATLVVHLVGLRKKLRFLRPGLPGLNGVRALKELAIVAAHVVALAAGLWVCTYAGGAKQLAMQQAVLVVVVATYLLLLWHRARGKTTPMAKFAALSVPLLFGILFAKYRDVLTNLFASFTGTGVFSDLKYARKIGEAPNTLVIAALSVAILPHLCELATGKKWGEFADVMTKTIRIIVIFFVPLAALTVVLRRPVIELLFDRGTWSEYHLAHAGDALGLYILSLPFFAIENPIQQSFFAMQRMWAPTLVGFLGTGFHILFLFVGIEWLGYGYFMVVALVYVSARAFKNVILLIVMRTHVKILPWRESLVFLGKALVITAGVTAASYFTYGPIKRALPLEAYRRHEVMIDTFNVELRGWEADNVDEFRIVTDEEPEGEEFLRDSPPGHGIRAMLLARYRRAPRRVAGLRCDVSVFDVTMATHIQVGAVFTEQGQGVLELETARGGRYRSPAFDLIREPARPIKIPVTEFGADQVLDDVVAVWIRDITCPRQVASVPTKAAVFDVRLISEEVVESVEADATHDVWPITRTRHVIVGGGFTASTSSWEVVGEMEPLEIGSASVEDTKERAESPELALHLPASEPRRWVVRGLDSYRLDGTSRLSFKARADRACEVRVEFMSDEHPVMLPSDPLWETVLPVEATEERRGYSCTFGEPASDGADPIDAGRIGALVFHVPAGVDFWLDNVAFVREPKGMRVGPVSVNYELRKLIHVGVPSVAAFAVLILLLWLLRVEEARDGWAWIRERVLSKVMRKLRRGKS